MTETKHEAQLRRQRKYRATAKGRLADRRYELKFRASLKGRYHAYRNNAAQRGIEFTLTPEQFSSFWQQACSYCAAEIKLVGLDRVDNKRGYESGNVVSCCSPCNYMKREMTREAFIEHCRRVVACVARELWTQL